MAARPVRMQEEGKVYRRRALFFSVSLFFFFFSLWDPLPSCGAAAAAMEGGGDRGRQCGTEARRINFSDAKLWRRRHHSQEIKDSTNDAVAFDGWGEGRALDYDSQLCNQSGRATDLRWLWLSISFGRPSIHLHIQTMLCPAHPALPALHVLHDEKKKRKKNKKNNRDCGFTALCFKQIQSWIFDISLSQQGKPKGSSLVL